MAGSLTEHLVASLSRPIAAADRERASLHVLDWAACAAAGAREPVAAFLPALAEGGRAGPCSLVAGGSADATAAVLVNAGLGNVLEMDDVHRGAIVHPGDTIVPACLAVAEAADLPGEALLDAVITGYEVAIRLGLAAGTGHYRLWYTTATCGTFGTAAAIARLLGLAPERVVDALGHAGMMASGLWQCREEPTASKQLATAHAAQAGVMAARYAGAGARGPHRILEGALGFFAATCPTPRPEAITAPVGPWLIHEVSFKPWPACRHVHPAIEAALALRDRVAPGEIAAVRVATYRDALAFADRPDPTTPHEARFSLQHCVAAALLDGPVTLAHSAPEALACPHLGALRHRVALAEDPDRTARYPGRFSAGLAITRADGTVLTAAVESARGDPENPMSADEIREKARGLLSGALTPEAAGGAVAAAAALPGGLPVRAFGRALRADDLPSNDGRIDHAA
ncbi:MmgE/PrpD family protein [Methylobacterium terricola]|uniref:MmgE/PrpD family protein n=1 Tax=Methylobacterium terricola TaxID=2583531 RepID=A0A5C4LE14_9HYPH|nr:MmgE/PrpD family protein [Methylobacterium terricola]TNC11612.1 MmgE/PrpD family protein [Methylobacterium terricola]